MPRYSPRTGQLTEYQVGPFDSTHIYVQWGGKLPGNEQWSCGFRLWKAAGSTQASADALVGKIGDAVNAFHIRTTSHIGNKALLSFVKVNAIALDGTYQASGTTERIFPDIAGGQPTFVSDFHPNQVAWAVTLNTGFTRGPAHKGRFYIPLPAIILGADQRADVTDCQSLAQSANTLLSDVNAGGAEVMVVMSRKAGKPGHRAVTGTSVGQVLDTQRRRRRSLVENNQTSTTLP